MFTYICHFVWLWIQFNTTKWRHIFFWKLFLLNASSYFSNSSENLILCITLNFKQTRVIIVHLTMDCKVKFYYLGLSHTEGSKSNIHCCALLSRQVRATLTFAWWTRATWRTSYANFARNICVTYSPDTHRIHSRRMRTSHPRIRRFAHLPRATKECYFWSPL
jgi:hypothetical protein